jgi:N6-L-threonylcarbamoyladenine synthase
LIGVNHLEGHVYAHWLRVEGDAMPKEELPFPLLILIVSGGHSELFLMREHLKYERLGQTVDDASGEAFDKVARLLNLGYPGGPVLEKAAARGNPAAYHFAKPKLDGEYDFSFSGIKTAVLREVQRIATIKSDGTLPPGVPVADLAASFQASVVDQLCDKTVRAAEDTGATAILMGGGVSANKALRMAMKTRARIPVYWPPLWLCTDNAAMIGATAYWRFQAGQRAGWDLDVEPGLKLE